MTSRGDGREVPSVALYFQKGGFAMLEALAKIFDFGCLHPGGRRKKQIKKNEQKAERLPLTPEEAYRKRVAKRKRKAQKGARRRNRR
jgi:hypothetical protein